VSAEAVTAPESTPGAEPVVAADGIGLGGERLTRDEAFDLVKRAVGSLVQGDTAVPASALRRRAFELLGRDSESLSERFFDRVLRDAHDAEVIDLRRRGDSYEVSLPADVAPVAEQLNRAAAARSTQAAPAPAGAAAPAPRGMGPRGIPLRGRPGTRPAVPPPDLLAIGVVEEPSAPATVAAEPEVMEPAAEVGAKPRRGRGRPRAPAKTAKKESKAAAVPEAPAGAAAPPKKKAGTRRGPGRAGKGSSSGAAA
jgi:hypothetical protein